MVATVGVAGLWGWTASCLCSVGCKGLLGEVRSIWLVKGKRGKDPTGIAAADAATPAAGQAGGCLFLCHSPSLLPFYSSLREQRRNRGRRSSCKKGRGVCSADRAEAVGSSRLLGRSKEDGLARRGCYTSGGGQ